MEENIVAYRIGSEVHLSIGEFGVCILLKNEALAKKLLEYVNEYVNNIILQEN